MQPTKCIKRRAVSNEDGTPAGMEEYYDYVFPDDDESRGLAKLAALAKQMAAGELLLDDELDDSDQEENSVSDERLGAVHDEDVGDHHPAVGGQKRPASHELHRESDENQIDIDDV